MLQFNYNKKNPLAKILCGIYTGFAWKACAILPKSGGAFGAARLGRKSFEWVWGGKHGRRRSGGLASGGEGARCEMRSFYNYITNNEEERRKRRTKILKEE